MGIDVEGLMYLFNRYESEQVLVELLIADAVAHEIEAGHTRVVLQEAIDAGRLEWVPEAKAVRRPA